MDINTKVGADYANLLVRLEECAGKNGSLLNKAIRRLASLDPIRMDFAEADDTYKADILDAVLRLRMFWRLRDGVASDSNLSKEFWESPEGDLLAKAEYWLMKGDLISRSEAICLVKGYNDECDIERGDRVWIHSCLYPRKNKPTIFGLYAREWLSRKEVINYANNPPLRHKNARARKLNAERG